MKTQDEFNECLESQGYKRNKESVWTKDGIYVNGTHHTKKLHEFLIIKKNKNIK